MGLTIDVVVLPLGTVELPDWHPRSTDRICTINGAAVRHPDGVIVFDTGTADDHPLIDDLYRPTVVPIVDALHGVGVDERDVVAIVNSHLHFDHCGQNRALPDVPVWVQRDEHALIDAPMFTVPDWARVDPQRARWLDGDAELAPGIRIVATPGHTPGHQSLLVVDDRSTVVLGGQCCYTCGEFAERVVVDDDVHDPSWATAAADSLERLHDLEPDVVYLAHDPTPWRRP